MKKLKIFAILTFLLAGTVGLASCSRPAVSENDSSSGPIRLAAGSDPSYTPVFVAADQGFFKEQGLDVKYFTTEGGPTMTQAVTAGEADMAVQSDVTAMTLMASDDSLRSLGVFEYSDTYIKTVFRKGITSPKELKTMATLPGLFKLLTVRYLEHEGVDPSKVKLSEVSAPDIPTILKRGDADGTVIFEPWATRAAKESGGSIVGDISDFGKTYSQWLMTTDSWLKENESDAGKVLAALQQADEFIKKNPDKAANITEKAIKTPRSQTLELMKELKFNVRDLDDQDVAAMEDAAKYFVNEKSIPEAPDLNKQMLVGWWSKHKP